MTRDAPRKAILIGRSTTTEPMSTPKGVLAWALVIKDQLATACVEWSEPVEFRLKRLEDGRMEMWMRGTP
jgi:hypothetical protein